MTKKAEFANRVDLDESVHNELSHVDLHCLPSFFCFNFQNIVAWPEEFCRLLFDAYKVIYCSCGSPPRKRLIAWVTHMHLAVHDSHSTCFF